MFEDTAIKIVEKHRSARLRKKLLYHGL